MWKRVRYDGIVLARRLPGTPRVVPARAERPLAPRREYITASPKVPGAAFLTRPAVAARRQISYLSGCCECIPQQKALIHTYIQPTRSSEERGASS